MERKRRKISMKLGFGEYKNEVIVERRKKFKLSEITEEKGTMRVESWTGPKNMVETFYETAFAKRGVEQVLAMKT